MPDNFLNGANITEEYRANAGILANMINRIGQTYITGAPNVYNPFSAWVRPVMDYGDTVQSYFVPYIEGREPDFDPVDPNPFKTAKPEVEAQYATLNDSIQYKITMYNNQLKKAFTSRATFGDMESQLMDTMMRSYGLDDFIKWKKYLSSGFYAPVKESISDDADFGANLLREIKSTVTSMFRYPSDEYNARGVMTASPAVDVVITTDAKNLIDASLSGVYNVDYLRIEGVNWIEIDSFGTVDATNNVGDDIPAGGDLQAVVLTRGMASRIPRTPQVTNLFNPESLYTNYWYTEESIFMMDLWSNAAQFYKTTT